MAYVSQAERERRAYRANLRRVAQMRREGRNVILTARGQIVPSGARRRQQGQ